jgi:gliding motility-associated-like protein
VEQFEAQVTMFAVPVVQLGNDTTLCNGQGMTLDAGNPGATYVWSTGATTQTIEVAQAGTYSVEVSNAGCTDQGALTVTFADAPENTLEDATACIDQPQELDAGNPGANYLWSTGDTTRTLTATQSGAFSVVVTLANGCEDTFSAQIELVPYPVIELGPDTALCEGEMLLLDAGEGPGTYTWTTGDDGRQLEVRQSGIYGVVVDNGHCISSASLQVTFNPSPIRMAAKELFACLDEEPRYVVIDAGNPGSNYSWNTGQTSQVILAGAYGWYFVDIVNVHDCAVRDSVVVTEYCPSTIYVPNTFTPNGDGINDIFLPVGKNIASLEMIVFDRWGGVLFETRDPNVGWDGTFRGEPVKNDMYIWKMRYRFYEDKDGRMGLEQERMGHIQVLR